MPARESVGEQLYRIEIKEGYCKTLYR